MSDKVFVGRKAATLSVPPAFDPISKIVILVDSENVYEAGDETGLTLELTCPYGTQTLADNLLALHRGFTYQPLEAGDALMDPSAELGDGVTIAGAYTMLAEQELEFDSHLASAVKAPGQQELESEYPFQTKEQQLERKIARTRSMISKTAEQIYLEVAKKVDEGQANTLISAAIGKIELSVSSKNGSTSFVLTDGEAEISAQTLNLTVPAVNITGKLTASQIDTDELEVDAANITGTLRLDQMASISFEDLSDHETVQGDIDDAYWMAYYAQSDVADITYTYNGKTYIDEDRIMAGSVIAGSLMGGSVSLLDGSEREAGLITLSGASTASYAVDIESNAGMRLIANGGIYLDSGFGTFIMLNDGDINMGRADVRPSPAGAYSSGTASWYWADVYSENALIEVSDRNKKTGIVYGLDGYDLLFDGLKPVSFLFTGGSSGRRHFGMVAQDVEETLTELGYTTLDVAAFIKSPRKDNEGNVIENEYEYALRYGEFISLLIDQVQKLKRRVAELEAKA